MRQHFLKVILSMCIIFFGFSSGDKNQKTSKVLTIDHYNFISVNEIMMYISNNGGGSHNPLTDGQGLFWPGGPSATIGAVFEDGLVWGGIINNDTLCGGSTYRHGLQAGKILENGTADDPTMPKYRVYKVLDGWENLPPGPERDQYELDYNEWPAADGAPFNDMDKDGIYTPSVDNPYIGDETMWCVSNDLDPSLTMFLYGSMPMGFEMQTLVYAFNLSGFLGNTIFKKYTIINRGQYTIDDMHLAFWSDDDLGNAIDDFEGCDTNLMLAYTYNGDDNDEDGYGTPPPAVGHMIVQGPIVPALPSDSAYFKNEWRPAYKNLPMTAFVTHMGGVNTLYQDPDLGTHQGAIDIFNNMNGIAWNGADFIDPNTGEPTTYVLSGNPVSGMGWYEGDGWPGGPAKGDRRGMLSAGPFSMAPGDTQEIVIAIYLAQGSDNIQSVAALKERGLEIQNYYGAYTITGVEDSRRQFAEGFKLMQNYPNPFNPVTNISYFTGRPSFVSLKVYDVLGRLVKSLVNEEKPAGSYSMQFDGSSLSSGIYFYKITAGEFTATKKLILIK